MLRGVEALERLQAGNRRYVEGNKERERLCDIRSDIDRLSNGQNPFAVILGCSDSRVPAEIVFDQGLGDLFVIRVAGNIVAPSLIGSVEFAIDAFDTRLVVVLGHSGCGAVTATIEQLRHPTAGTSPNLLSIVDRIRPAVVPLTEAGVEGDLLELAVRANVRASVSQLRSSSELLEREVQEHGLQIVGAEYSLKTGVVEFFDTD